MIASDIIFKTCWFIIKLPIRDHLITSRYSHQVSNRRRERVFNISGETESEVFHVYMIVVYVQWRKIFWNLKKHKNKVHASFHIKKNRYHHGHMKHPAWNKITPVCDCLVFQRSSNLDSLSFFTYFRLTYYYRVRESTKLKLH